MNAMTLNMTAATASIGDNSASITDALVAKMKELGKSEANGGAARRDAGIYLTQKAYAGDIDSSFAEVAYDTYVTAQGKQSTAKHMTGSNDNPKSRKAQVSKFNSFIKLGLMPQCNGPEVLARSIAIMENLVAAGTKVISDFDALKAICTAQGDFDADMTDEQIAAVVSKPEANEKDLMAKLVAAYKAMHKLNTEAGMAGTEVALQGIADAIVEAGGEVPPVTKEEKKEAEALAFLAKRGRI